MRKLPLALAFLIVITATLAAYQFDAARISARSHPGAVTLVYVGAEDCPPCRTWERIAESAFRTSALFSRVTYRVVKSPTLFAVLSDENWPDDLRRYREHVSPQAGVPLWLVIADGRVVTQASGESQWRESIVPRMRSLLD